MGIVETAQFWQVVAEPQSAASAERRLLTWAPSNGTDSAR